MNVTATGTCRPRANARSSGDARRRSTPLPARTIGRSAPAMRSAARSIASSVGSGKAACREHERRERRPSTSVAAMSSGSSMWVGPGFSRRATRNALATISGIAPGTSTRVVHFVTGSNIRGMSTYWCDSLWTLSMPVWPVIATIGARSR